MPRRTLALLLLLLVAGACRTASVNGVDVVEERSGDGEKLEWRAPADCDNALFARNYESCPTPEAVFPRIWDALKPAVTQQSLRATLAARAPAFDECCGKRAVDAVVDLDFIVDCNGAVVDVEARVLGSAPGAPLFVGGCIEDVVRAWQLEARPAQEQAVHALLSCGAP